MADERPSGDAPRETADRLRADIDRGRTGDKVPVTDPAAAPLGTDDETAGTPPTAAEVAAARAGLDTPGPPQPSRGLRGSWVGLIFIIVLCIAAVVIVWLVV